MTFLKFMSQLHCLSFLGLVVGTLILVSPQYTRGGILGWLFDIHKEDWINWIFLSLMSFTVGLAAIGGSILGLAVSFGVAIGSDKPSKARDQLQQRSRLNSE